MAASSKTAQRILDVLKELGGEPKEKKSRRQDVLEFDAFGGCGFSFLESTASVRSDEDLLDQCVTLARAGTGDDSIGEDTKEAPLEDKKTRKKKAKIMEKALDIAGSDDEHKTAVLEDME